MGMRGHTDLSAAKKLYRPRPRDAHKGTMGHAALVAGSYGMLGAAILAARACLRSGVGKLTCYTQPEAYPILQASVPEAIFQIGRNEDAAAHLSKAHFQSIGFGPGIGSHPAHGAILNAISQNGCPIVLDADALNHIARAGSEIGPYIPEGSVLTPHPGEYQRLFGQGAMPGQMAIRFRICLIVKGADTVVYSPDGGIFENRSGNAGMATAGSGDVLTGMITGLLARGYPLLDACRMGVYLHGLAGDLAAESVGQESLIASDIIEAIPSAFQRVADTH